MPARATIPNREDVSDDTPLRLDVAAKLFFPDGSMTAEGLRLEARRGHLVISRAAGKTYTTRARINAMMEICRLEAEAPDSGNDQPAGMPAEGSPMPAIGSSSMDEISAAHAAASTIVQELKQHSGVTSPKSGCKKRSVGNVIPLKSRSPTS